MKKIFDTYYERIWRPMVDLIADFLEWVKVPMLKASIVVLLIVLIAEVLR